MHYKERFIFGCVLVFGLGLSCGAQAACSTLAEWDQSGGAIVTGSPTPDSIWRYSEYCGLEVSDTGFVEDDTPSAETKFRARFYFYSTLTGGVGPSAGTEIFEAFDTDPSSDTLHVFFNGSQVSFHTGAASSALVNVNPGWNLIELNWISGGMMDYWVNADATSIAPTGQIAAGTAVVNSASLGILSEPHNFTGGSLFLDGYDSVRNDAIGPLIRGDADGSGNPVLNIFDVVAQLNEIHLNGLAAGQPDCDETGGKIDIFDAVCVLNIIHAPPP